MSANQNLKFWGAALSALFSACPLAHAGEWDAYLDLKAALVRSSSKKDVPLPSWLNAKPFQPYPHYYLDDKNSKPVAPNVSVSPIQTKSADQPCPSGVTCAGIATLGDSK